jgi:hypothetical protein
MLGVATFLGVCASWACHLPDEGCRDDLWTPSFDLIIVDSSTGRQPVSSYRGWLFADAATFDVTPDGQKFLVRMPAPLASNALTVVQNWTKLLER